jgi:hypothetical protein
MQALPATRLALFICSKIFDSLLEGTQVHKERFSMFHRWIKRLEQELNSTPAQHLTSSEAQVRLTGTLEVRLVAIINDQ